MGALTGIGGLVHDQVRGAALMHEETVDSLEVLLHRGFRIFPCRPRDKKPLLRGWQVKASSSLSAARDWVRQNPGCNWGVATGPQSAVFILDVDGEAGRSSLSSLERIYGPLPFTLTSRSGRSDGGEHRWFRYPADREIRNSAGTLGRGLDIRGAGGYVVAPPSTHETGSAYRWVDLRAPVEDAPSWLLELVSTSAPNKDDQRMRKTDAPAERSGPTNLKAPTPRFDILVKGGRNDGLFRYACALRKRGSTREQIESELLAMNDRRCIPPLPKIGPDGVLTIAASAARYPVGGPDLLESAWQAVQGEKHARGYEQFIAIARNLQRERPKFSIALPLERIGEVMGVHWTQVGRWRRRAVRDGWLHLAENDIPHRKAACFFFKEVDEELSH